MDEQQFETEDTMSSIPQFIRDALAYSLEKIMDTSKSITTFPELTKDGKWIGADDGGWTGAHWTGLLWLAYAHTGDKRDQTLARDWTQRLFHRQKDTTTHDLGFLFELSFMLGSKLTDDDSLKQPALQAAETLIKRFNTKGKYIQAWGPLDGTVDERGRIIMDTLMNLDLLFHASKESNEHRYYDIALSHAQTTLKYLVRPDWSTAHVADFNPETGEYIKQDTHQGLSATSCWARGQAWSVYGFLECFRETGDPIFLDASKNLAEYFLRRLPDDLIPYWDFDSPLIPNDVRDSSASAIVASALLNLANYETDKEKSSYWRDQGIRILEALWDNYSSRNSNEQSILIHGTRHKPYGHVDSGLIYGDYYFVEALTRILKPHMKL